MEQWAQGRLLYFPYYLVTLEWQNINPRSTQLSDLSMPTSVTWQPGLLPPVRVCRAMALLNLPAEWYCPSFSGTCPVKEMPGWNDSVFLGISHVCSRYTRHLLFLFLLFKRKNRDSSSGPSSWKGKRVSLTAELLESRSVLWKCAEGLSQGGFKSRTVVLFLQVLPLSWVHCSRLLSPWWRSFFFLPLKGLTLHLCSLASILGDRG